MRAIDDKMRGTESILLSQFSSLLREYTFVGAAMVSYPYFACLPLFTEVLPDKGSSEGVGSF